LPAFLLAQATSDNTAGGAYFSLWFPLGLFILVAAILWMLYGRPHHRVPPRRPAQAGAAAQGAGTAGTATGWGHDESPQSGRGAAPSKGPAAPGSQPPPGRARPGRTGGPDDDEGRVV
jgi:hypothetical protein